MLGGVGVVRDTPSIGLFAEQSDIETTQSLIATIDIDEGSEGRLVVVFAAAVVNWGSICRTTTFEYADSGVGTTQSPIATVDSDEGSEGRLVGVVEAAVGVERGSFC